MPIPYQEHTVYRTIKDLGPHVSPVDQLDLSGIFFVCHDWGEPTGLSALLTRPQKAKAIAVMSTWAWGDRRNKPEVQEVVNAKYAGAMDLSRS